VLYSQRFFYELITKWDYDYHKYIVFTNRSKKIMGYIRVSVIAGSEIIIEKLCVTTDANYIIIK